MGVLSGWGFHPCPLHPRVLLEWGRLFSSHQDLRSSWGHMPPPWSLGTRLGLWHPVGPAPTLTVVISRVGVHSQCLGEAMDDVGRQSLISHSGDQREGSYPIFWEPVRMASLLAQSGKGRASHTRQGLATCEGPLFMLTRATGTPDRGLAHTRGAPGSWAFRHRPEPQHQLSQPRS